LAKREIDDILSELGVSGDEPAPARTRAPEKPRTPHAIDRAVAEADTKGVLPTAPIGQRPAAQANSAETSATQALNVVYQPDEDAGQAPLNLSDLLVSSGAVSQQQVTTAQTMIKQSPGRRLVDVLVEQGADETAVQRCVAQVANLPFERVDLDKGLEGGFDGALLQRLTPDYCKQHGVLPLRKEGLRAVVGVTRPDDVFLLDEVRRRLNVAGLKVVVITAFDVRAALEILGDTQKAEEQVDVSKILSEVEEGDVQVEKKSEQEVDLERESAESPVIKYVNYIIQTAVKEGASDIHIEPAEKKLKVRFRIDGELYEMMNPPASMAAAITSRLKIMANLDISERRLPQDGRIRCTVQGRKLDLRMSTLPVTNGEKTVMRILDTRSINVKLEDLGFDDNIMQLWKNAINAPHGIVLVTGPTGSGKTTTLYSSLRTLDKNSMNVSTVEDPVEYHLDGIVQTQTHDKIGMTFGKALKALLRQDPDVIMVGEIRDHDTALTAVQAALTGHLVLSTLHTNDAPSSITRLVNIGIESFLVGAAVNAVLAQRLLRRLCTHCKHETVPNEEMREFLNVQGMNAEKLWSPKGCDRCHSRGYSGRVGIYELLVVDDSLRDIVARNPNVAEFRRLCVERGMVSLRGDGLKKAARGLTSVEEVLRITEATI
jgi:type IV pilus assembly protein PilB